MNKGSLVVVGTGIQTVGHITPEAVAWIKWADTVLYLVADLVAENAILKLKPEAQTLEGLYEKGKPRYVTYRQMTDRMVDCVRKGQRTCAAYYGHPGVFAYPAHAAIRKLRTEGYEARMLPGISAEDCLFADLGLDPATYGCQSYEATHFVLTRRRPDTTASLILWQPDSFGHVKALMDVQVSAIAVLVDYLAQFYPRDHRLCIYEAPMYLGCAARMDWVPLAELAEARLTPASTLYLPPAEIAPMDLELAEKLGLPSMAQVQADLARLDPPSAPPAE
ncbi:SAM-dependent methyltransferase [Polyangium sp. 15x6]|uniref:SAM-dependent methyltransferase n=1 Tax=Polyangium sp. 15x6 TaxID=3042687 RepID=UPI00249C9CCE|nr:SAM-dependent methyltransferase [Polyangium sp. 15x6]MDI3291211.1 SAM-dependent methyltransferase [Polyangium sp. 15x6]